MLLIFASSVTYAHSGRTNKKGCHKEKSTQTRHCH
ncbi:MAG: YHYH domain-containing protein [Methylococcales bacterium]|nr:YHYH domain-containing protein [Methylococcales bacterium]